MSLRFAWLTLQAVVMTGVQLSHVCSILPICYIFVIISMCTFPCSCSAEEKGFVTMVTLRPQFRGSEQPYYYCYVNSPDLEVTVSTSRVVPTRDGTNFWNNRNPDPPDPVQDSSPSYPSGTTVYRIDIDFENDYEFGTYACDVNWDDGMTEYTTSVSNIIMLSNGNIYPASSLVTQTVNVGETNVNIEMYLDDTVDEDDLEWRHNNRIIRRAGSSSETYSFSRAIRESDEGVYICYESDLWEDAFHGMQRLIVRGCQANRWGPLCNGICDNCYHGGVCDDETGRCICPPGFMGPNCLRACGRNRFGYNCEFNCSTLDSNYSCLQRQFCLVDPYGCSCSTGLTGLSCYTVCAQGTFGANCLQDCHCRQYCNIFTGGCQGTCEQGWSGQSCQIPDICPNDYYGSDCVEKCRCKDDASCDKETGQCPNQECHPGYTVYPGSVSCQECQEGYFGDLCRKECRCEASACDKVTGECSGQCKPQWTYTNCQTGLVSSEAAKVNPNTAAQVHCTAEGTSFSLNLFGHFLSRSQDVRDTSNIIAMMASSSDDGGIVRRTTPFRVSDVTTEEQLFCQLTYRTIIYAVLPVTVYVYDLPELTYPPEQVSLTSSEVTISWIAWDSERDVGDPPVVSYIPYYKRSSSDDWISGDAVDSDETLEFRVANLEADTSYTFAVAAVREGFGGKGPRGPSLMVKTLCDDLPELTYPPEQVNVTSSEVTISWIAWDSERDVGDPPVVFYIPYYKRSLSDEWISGATVDSKDTLEFRVADLEADTSYMFAVAAAREGLCGEVPRGPSLMVKTLCDVEPSTPVEVTASLTTKNQVRVTWRVNTEEIMCSSGISNFSVYYVTEGSSKGQKFVTMVTADRTEIMIESSDLGIGSYTFYVTFTTDVESTLNIQGDKSSNAAVYLKPEDTTSDMISGSPFLIIVPVLAALILLCIVVVFILLRRKKKRRKESTQDVYENTPCDENKAPNSNLSGEYEGIESKLDKSDETVMVDIKKQTASLKRSSTLEEYQETEDSEDENAEHIYSNLQAPDPIKVAMFEDYVKSNADNLEQEFEILKKGKLHPWTIAESQSNKKKNRFKNMLTYDHSRVVLNKIPGDLSSDYYNASHIQNQKGENAFIASQGPNIASLDDFWRMVYQQNVSTIVMITNLYEGGKDRCSQYWPEAEGSTKSFGNLEIAWSKTSTFSDFVIRNFTLRHGKEKDEKIHHIQQFHFLTWPDMSVPKEVTPVLEFVKQVKLAGKEKKTPTLVHCSAGIGRTGTFIALSSLMDVLRNEKVLSVFDFVEQMRENRINMVQTSKQYLFLYKCLLEFHQTRHTEIPAGLLGSFDLNSKKDILLQEHKLLNEIGDVILKMKKNQDGLKEDNRPRNRFPEKVPYDGSRPFLVSWGSGGNDEGYINATILKSFTKQDAFISTQSPLPNTIEDFWKMVFDWNCSLIVMLNQLDPDDETCMQYWSDEDSAEFGSMTITCVVEEDETIFTRRVFEISHVHSEGKKSIHHLQLHSWPPESNLSAVLGLIQEVEKLQHHLSIMSPIVVHCIDGVGRSGVFVTVLSELERIEKNNSIDVFRTGRQLRQRHPDFLSNKEDYLLCHQLLQAHLIDTCEYQNI